MQLWRRRAAGPASLGRQSLPLGCFFAAFGLCVLSAILGTGEHGLFVAAGKSRSKITYFGTLTQKAPNWYRCSSTRAKEEVVGHVTLNKEHPDMTIECVDDGLGGEFLPLEGATSSYPRVCHIDAKDKGDCERNKGFLTDYIPGAKQYWYKIEKVENNGEQSVLYKFTVPWIFLPPAKQRYKVGCRYPNHEYCFVEVTVEPTPPMVEGKRVTCGYPESGPVNLEVDLSKDANFIEIRCGEQHHPQPSTYTLQYCSGDSVDPQKCSPQSLTNIFYDYSSSWWKGKLNGPDGATLTIPPGGFPEEDKSFLVGCSLTVDGPPFCNVKVRVAGNPRKWGRGGGGHPGSGGSQPETDGETQAGTESSAGASSRMASVALAFLLGLLVHVAA
ncbi:SAG-related sequence SRS57 [Toxoplasma gondii GAB2-2007-GAL-DOM2]|uniref:SRS57 n=22 Tax=Toxoplasma gondii TaxID=5811 RepID=A0A0F7V6G5_TOXGV|nr:surface antigen [Toxoplasma gondii]ESS28355.1 SAG-related sequence SRS57 [Toxoplasma gondii VEG]KFG28702.1 SAG-related sequence SRS57 [Toxoplasma gondii p89]KFG33002.1 SAG-related sequence SRS57 [Toxoplasma gondii FOU]KFG47827.1 SAG-related sequence SRS57 [Toxoplasma gondii GAB2-2007-GAL-DOM2]PUA83521.1 SAG-related sequence SRS57 [Toxoplasma gondii TgCATBr9]